MDSWENKKFWAATTKLRLSAFTTAIPSLAPLVFSPPSNDLLSIMLWDQHNQKHSEASRTESKDDSMISISENSLRRAANKNPKCHCLQWAPRRPPYSGCEIAVSSHCSCFASAGQLGDCLPLCSPPHSHSQQLLRSIFCLYILKRMNAFFQPYALNKCLVWIRVGSISKPTSKKRFLIHWKCSIHYTPMVMNPPTENNFTEDLGSIGPKHHRILCCPQKKN